MQIKIATTPAAERMTPTALAEERKSNREPDIIDYHDYTAGAIYENAVLLSAATTDIDSFERHMALLTPYYTDFG